MCYECVNESSLFWLVPVSIVLLCDSKGWGFMLLLSSYASFFSFWIFKELEW